MSKVFIMHGARARRCINLVSLVCYHLILLDVCLCRKNKTTSTKIPQHNASDEASRLSSSLVALWPLGRTARTPFLGPPVLGHPLQDRWSISFLPTWGTSWYPSNNVSTWRVCSHIAPWSSSNLVEPTHMNENPLDILTNPMYIDKIKMDEVLACPNRQWVTRGPFYHMVLCTAKFSAFCLDE
jgi:hypothetical protein